MALKRQAELRDGHAGKSGGLQKVSAEIKQGVHSAGQLWSNGRRLAVDTLDRKTNTSPAPRNLMSLERQEKREVTMGTVI